MKFCITLLFVLIAFTGFSQTRRIDHRSHGGSMLTKGDGTNGNYGIPYNEKRYVIIHLESGRDTAVFEDDSLARPYYADSVRRKYKMPDQKKKIHGIGQMGKVSGRLVITNP